MRSRNRPATQGMTTVGDAATGRGEPHLLKEPPRDAGDDDTRSATGFSETAIRLKEPPRDAGDDDHQLALRNGRDHLVLKEPPRDAGDDDAFALAIIRVLMPCSRNRPATQGMTTPICRP